MPSFNVALCSTDVLVAAIHPLDMENLFLLNDGTYNGLQAYKNSKVANLLFTYELSRQLDGSGVKVNAIDPGKITHITLDVQRCLIRVFNLGLGL